MSYIKAQKDKWLTIWRTISISDYGDIPLQPLDDAHIALNTTVHNILKKSMHY